MLNVVTTTCLGCGRGEVCSSDNAATAYCDQCDFDSSLYQCGSYLLTEKPQTNETECVQGPVVVYSGTQLSFTGLLSPAFYHVLDRRRSTFAV